MRASPAEASRSASNDRPTRGRRDPARIRSVARWIAGRVGSALLVVWIVATVVFFALRASGDPLEAILGGPGSQAGPEAVAQAREEYGLDQPLILQYLTQLWRVATFQLGDSYARRQPVSDLIAAQLPGTLLLAALALLLAWTLALAGSTIAATARGPVGRAVVAGVRGLELVATVMPQFWLGAVLILVFAASLRILPATSGGGDPAGLILPVVTLAIPIAGFLAQLSRDALREADRAPFATTARSRGASESRVLLHHTLRHASLPALSLSGWAFGHLLSGAVVVESLFARPGLGRLLLDAAMSRDVPVVIGSVVVVAVLYVLVVTVVDAVELLVDPRLRRARTAHAVERTPELAVGS
ncbi:ABC transporter permease [Microbacterium sp.]|uniref:ABC transporter permease n=1 Tax=Microbacterium sp. TaxID=51671 RepID=UPI0028127027|nr:ABC transporter permease [Microbacterium sp.]